MTAPVFLLAVLFSLTFEQVNFIMGFRPGIAAFTAAVLGGIGSIGGAALGGFTLEPDHVAELTRWLVGIADAHCGGRIVSALEGGYLPDRLGVACVTHMRAMQ